MQHVTPGDDPNFRSQSYPARPPSVDTVAKSSGAPKLGGPIVSPRASNRERLARELKASRYNLALLAHSKYHGGKDGVPTLTIEFIHECGYNSFLPEDADDVIICYNDVILVHRKVVTGWYNHRTGRSGPLVEYILKKALLNFPKL